MPDKYVCDCGFTSETYAEKCPLCGEKIMKLDEFEDVDEDRGIEKYADESPEIPEDLEDGGVEKISLKRAV